MVRIPMSRHRRLRKPMQSSAGFTLLEMVTVLLIGGILAAISAPYFLSRAVAARQAEGKMLISTLNRAQQMFYTQNQKFSPTVESLALGISSRNYALNASHAADPAAYGLSFATSKQVTVRSYAGMAAIVYDAAGNPGMAAIACEADTPNTLPAATPTYTGTTAQCAPGTHPMK